MTEITQTNNANDKLATLQKEAEGLKIRLEDERQKLNDITCKCCCCRCRRRCCCF